MPLPTKPTYPIRSNLTRPTPARELLARVVNAMAKATLLHPDASLVGDAHDLGSRQSAVVVASRSGKRFRVTITEEV